MTRRSLGLIGVLGLVVGSGLLAACAAPPHVTPTGAPTFRAIARATQPRSALAPPQLAWEYTQGSVPATGFHVYRGDLTGSPVTCGMPGVRITPAPLPLTPTTFIDRTATPGMPYCYYVTAIGQNPDGSPVESPSSNVVTMLTPPTLTGVMP